MILIRCVCVCVLCVCVCGIVWDRKLYKSSSRSPATQDPHMKVAMLAPIQGGTARTDQQARDSGNPSSQRQITPLAF